MSDIRPLPESGNEFWDYAEVEVRKMEPAPKHEHVFEQVNSREIKCKCGMGLFIGLSDKVKDGHLYHNDKLVI